MMNRFENHLTNKRNSKLDSFLQNNLKHFGYGYIRFYEKCVIESKGEFLHCHLILTDEHLLVTQNPPRNLTHIISLGEIQDIRVVPERHAVIAGGLPNVITSQHVQIVYKRISDLFPPKEMTNAPIVPTSNPFNKISNGNKLENNGGIVARQTGIFVIPISIRLAFLPNYLSKNFPPMPRRTISAQKKSPKKTRMLEEESDESDSFKSVDISLNPDKSFDSGTEQLLPERASSVFEQSLSSWRPSGEKELVIGPESGDRRPSSVDLGQLPKARTLVRKYFAMRSQPQKQKIVKPSSLKQKTVEVTTLLDVNLHLYEANSVFLNELVLNWHRKTTKMTLQMEQKLSKSSEEKYPKINVLASKLSVQKEMVESIQVTTDIILLENELLRIRKTRTRVYYSLCDFREELIKNTSFQRVSFQNEKFVTSLFSLLQTCSLTTSTVLPDNPDNFGRKFLMEMLSIELILLDIFRLLVETNTGVGLHIGKDKLISFDRKGSLHWNYIMENLIILAISNEESLGVDTNRNVYDPSRFAAAEWNNDSDISVTSLLIMRFNICVSVLHETLSLFQYTPGGRQLPISITSLQVSHFLNRTMAHMFSFIIPSCSDFQMTPSETVMFHHQASVLWTFMNYFPSANSFIRERFREEFKYLVQEDGFRARIPDEYPIKEKVMSLFNSIRSEILKSSMPPSNVPAFLPNKIKNNIF